MAHSNKYKGGDFNLDNIIVYEHPYRPTEWLGIKPKLNSNFPDTTCYLFVNLRDLRKGKLTVMISEVETILSQPKDISKFLSDPNIDKRLKENLKYYLQKIEFEKLYQKAKNIYQSLKEQKSKLVSFNMHHRELLTYIASFLSGIGLSFLTLPALLMYTSSILQSNGDIYIIPNYLGLTKVGLFGVPELAGGLLLYRFIFTRKCRDTIKHIEKVLDENKISTKDIKILKYDAKNNVLVFRYNI